MLNQKELKQLPVDEYRGKIESCIKDNPVTIITAETGAGKSTRVPLWFFRQKKKVMVTQPRRIAARSLSYYLAGLCNTKWGTEIGYQTGFDRSCSRDTTLLYLTDGVAVIKEIKGNTDYDILVIDEVHEWNLNQEVLVGLVKKKINSRFYHKTGKRVIIMSATMQAQKLSAFLYDAPIISIPGRNYSVTMFYHSSYFLLADTAHMISNNLNTLVFLPGKKEIEEFIDLLGKTLKEDKIGAEILPLHSELSIKEQSKVFKHYKVPKVVIATDIAQTSLTIDDIDAVIDSGIKKEIYYKRGVEGLYPVDTSEAECKQRAGRAGRVRNGQYILCSDLEQKDRVKYPEPEIKRLNPESAILRFVKWGISPLDFSFFHPPDKGNIYKALKRLKVFGAITKDQQITADGARMADLPVSVRSARMILEAQKGSKQVFDDSLKIISVLEVKGIVNREYMGEKFYQGKYFSDLLNQLFIWKNTGPYKKIVNWKKLTTAKEVYRELKNRIKVNDGLPYKQADDQNVLFRSIISLFVDFIFNKVGNSYFHEDIERKVDKNSVICERMPEMITGLPFDLLIKKNDPKSGEEKEILIPLVTFVSELSFKLLEKLKPFTYHNKLEVCLENSEVLIRETIQFGGKVLKIFKREPDWLDKKEKSLVCQRVYEWYTVNEKIFKIGDKINCLKEYFISLKKILGADLKAFDFYKDRYLKDKIFNFLKTTDLNFFFKFSPCFEEVLLKDLLSLELMERLSLLNWPKGIKISGHVFNLVYFKGKPFIRMSMHLFEKIKRTDLILPNGKVAGVNLNGKEYYSWEKAVKNYNQYKKREIFKSLRYLKKKVRIEDLKKVNFPLTFNKGMGKDEVAFEFYSVPMIRSDEVFLIHFDNKDFADSHYVKIKNSLQKIIQKHEKEKIKNIFMNKGWKVTK